MEANAGGGNVLVDVVYLSDAKDRLPLADVNSSGCGREAASCLAEGMACKL